jgi:hypothetical protein
VVEPFISITWTQDVEDSEARIMVYTVSHLVAQVGRRLPFWFQFQALPPIRPFGDWVILMMPRGSAYSSVDWYLGRSRTADGARIDGPAYLRLVEMEPWQSSTPHFDVALVGQDLSDEQGRSVLALARTGLAAVASVHQLRRYRAEDERIVRLSSLVAHSLGRALGIPLADRPTGSLTHSGQEVYCANVCAMRAAASPDDLAAFDAKTARRWGFYCEACQRDAEAVIISAHYGLS